MPQGDLFIVMLLLWTFVGRGVDGERVTGVLHGRVELRGRSGHSPDVQGVEWTLYSDKKPTGKILLYHNKTCIHFCQNMNFTFQSMSLILFNLTQEHEGTYEEKTILKNGTFLRFNVTLSLLFASKITLSSSPDSLTLKCEISGEFKLLQWFRDDLPLPDDQRFSLTDNNKTMLVINLNGSDCSTYTCQVSNENGESAAHINISGNMSDVCQDKTPSAFSDFAKTLLISVGLSLIGFLVLCIIFNCICRYYGRRKVKTTSTEEPVYNEPTSFQEEAVPAILNPVYQDFIRPKDSHQSDPSEDFGYSTIADVLEKVQPSQTTCASSDRFKT